MADEVFSAVEAEVQSKYIPDDLNDDAIRELEKHTDVKFTIQHHEHLPDVYIVKGTLQAVQKAGSYLRNLYKDRQNAAESVNPGLEVQETDYVGGGDSRVRNATNATGSQRPTSENDRSFRQNRNVAENVNPGLEVQETHYVSGGDSRVRNATNATSYQRPTTENDRDFRQNRNVAVSVSPGLAVQETDYASGGRKYLNDIEYEKFTKSSAGYFSYDASKYTFPRQVECSLTFKTPVTRHNVSIYVGDLTKITADAVVCPTNCVLSHDCGVAKGIAKVGGREVTDAAYKYFMKNGPLDLSLVTHIRGGKLPSKFIIYAVGPIWKELKNKADCFTTLKDTFMNCFRYAYKMSVTHIALPLISSGICGGPIKECSEALYEAFMEFDRIKVRKPLEIHVVDINNESVDHLQMLFAEHLKSNSISFKKNRVASPLSRGIMHSTDISGRSGYSFDEKRSYSASPETTHDRNLSTKFKDSRIELSSNGSLNRNDSRESSLDFLPDRFNQPVLSFKTKKNCHKISIYFGDLTKMKADAIVNAANSYLRHFGGVAKAISDAGGYKVVEESNEYVRKWGPLFPSQVIQTSGGFLPAKYVIHAVGPVWKDYKHEKDCLDTLKATFMNCFQLASKGLEIKNIALPLISSGIFGVPIEKCVESLYLALMEFDAEPNPPLNIHIVDTSVEVINDLQARFSHYLKSNDIKIDTMESDRLSTQKYQTLSKDKQTDALSNGNPQSKRASNKRNVVDKIKSKVSKMGKSDFKVKENAKLSPTNGPMKALPIQSAEEAHLQKILEEYQRKGCPPSGFREIHSLVKENPTKNKRSKSLSRLPNGTVDLKETTSGERQSRRDSWKNNTSGSKEQPVCSRNQSLDRYKKQNEKKEQDFKSSGTSGVKENSRARSQSVNRTKKKKEKEQDSSNFESNDKRSEIREGSMECFLEDKRGGTRKGSRSRSQSFDRSYQKNGKETVRGKDDDKAFTMPSQQQSTKCSLCSSKDKLRRRKDCIHMICKSCYSILGDKNICFDCKHHGNNIEQNKQVSTSTEVNKNSMLSPTFDSPALSSNSSARRKRREKLSSEQNPPDYPEESTQRHNSSDFLSQRDYSESTSNIASQSPMKDIEQFLLPLPEPVEESCPICLSDCQNPVSLKNCNHIFCKQCIISAFKTKPACPICGVIYGCLVGNQPDGTMEIEKVQSSLPGYDGYATIIISYDIPSGTQNDSHPNPGSRYRGTSRRAYLPNTPEGQDICRLLQKAFDAKLIFTVGRSVTTGASNVVTWNDIHHKTSCTGGPSQFGYPDDTYLERVRDELAAKGIR